MRFEIALPHGERFTRQVAGAVATVSLELSRCLEAMGHDVRVVTPRGPGEPLDGVNTRVLRYGTPRFRVTSLVQRVARRLASRLRPNHSVGALDGYRSQVVAAVSESRADVVIVHNEPALAALLSQSVSATVVLWLHNLMAGADARALAALPQPVRIVCVSEAVREWTSRELAVPVDRMTVIHNGVDPQRFKPATNAVAGGPGDRPLRVVLHGRIDPNKGQELAARTVAGLRAEGLQIELTLLGSVVTFGLSQTEQADFERRISEATRAAGAHVTGWVPSHEIPTRLGEFDVALVLPTAPDPFPLAGLEAMASGLAVVAIPLGGVAEMVDGAALLVEPHEQSVGAALRSLAADPELLRLRQRLSRERASSFTWPAAAEKLIAVLDLEDATRPGADPE